jgi:hypothetical protein
MMGEIKEEPLSDSETEPALSLVEVQLTDKQEQISEPFSFIEVKNEYQVNIIFPLCHCVKKYYLIDTN